MAELQFIDHHNMLAMLSKVKESEGFHEILDFLRSSHLAHALTVNPRVYVDHIQQFWTNATIHGDEGNQTIRSLVHVRTIIISEALIRTHLQLADEEGIFSLPSETLFVVTNRYDNNPGSSGHCRMIAGIRKDLEKLGISTDDLWQQVSLSNVWR